MTRTRAFPRSPIEQRQRKAAELREFNAALARVAYYAELVAKGETCMVLEEREGKCRIINYRLADGVGVWPVDIEAIEAVSKYIRNAAASRVPLDYEDIVRKVAPFRGLELKSEIFYVKHLANDADPRAITESKAPNRTATYLPFNDILVLIGKKAQESSRSRS